MRIGVPKEIKTEEYRVALVPAGAQRLGAAGHQVLVEAGAGAGAGIPDQAYQAAGAQLTDAAGAWGADMVIKVKEPLPSEYDYFRPGLLLYTYLHLAAQPELTRRLASDQVSAVAYETIQLADGSLPLLTPMSEVAGRMAVQAGAHWLEKPQGGRGVLLGGVPGVSQGHVVILGAGVVGHAALKMALGLGAKVTVINRSFTRLAYLDDLYGGRITTLISLPDTVANLTRAADLVIGAVLVPGAKAPMLVSEQMVEDMPEGSVIVDVAIDQGGCVATMRPTSHSEPVYTVHGVIHYGVANIPGAVARTSTFALTNATLGYALELAGKGLAAALEDPALALGVNVAGGRIVHPAVGASLGLETAPLDQVV
ncbi:MAG: alanine dehydrogenase [Desulfarculaceae bacterium]|nr:alanine dehydrogenase [Desulfarculaceae bacterium]MCF8072568.1 alanine dehydrogenase [Desulfarculaceae bacterium]MCF8103471.1 alanine dehydrogenase [Desulfarculaceae bacterium]MCF8117511.1 alanine dehydrogenase [Desulfarculaceae bacterium]